MVAEQVLKRMPSAGRVGQQSVQRLAQRRVAVAVEPGQQGSEGGKAGPVAEGACRGSLGRPVAGMPVAGMPGRRRRAATRVHTSPREEESVLIK